MHDHVSSQDAPLRTTVQPIPTGLIHPPSFISYKSLRLLISDAPSDYTLPFYIQEFKKYHVTDVVRVCEPTYQRIKLEKLGIQIHDWPFDDGCEPPLWIIQQWTHLLKARFNTNESTACIAIHCIAGLGRAPMLAAIALIEYGMSPLDSIIYIRERRRGAINQRQLRYIENYRKSQSNSYCLIC
jgi:protein tyrosine phosphatase type 4A